jgi:hypothetical protein
LLYYLQLFSEVGKTNSVLSILLHLGGQVTHSEKVVFMDNACENQVKTVCKPPQTSRLLHNLDISFMFSLSTSQFQERETLPKRNTRIGVTTRQVANFFGMICRMGIFPRNTDNEFMKSGICPLIQIFYNKKNLQCRKKGPTEDFKLRSSPVGYEVPHIAVLFWIPY